MVPLSLFPYGQMLYLLLNLYGQYFLYGLVFSTFIYGYGRVSCTQYFLNQSFCINGLSLYFYIWTIETIENFFTELNIVS